VDAPALCELLYACLDEFAPVAIHDSETEDGWRVFFRTQIGRDRAAEAIRGQFADRLADIHTLDVDDEGWARRSQAGLAAIRVGRILVAPPWDDATQTAEIRIEIDPSMGFGTGHHETTRLCLEILQRTDVAGRRVIDVGTGSGILAIGAAKLNARSVLAIDHDPDALANARDNVRRNHCADVVEVREMDLSAIAVERGDVVTANLTASVLDRHASRLVDLLGVGGVLIASGFGPDEQPSIVDAFSALTPAAHAREGEWVAIALQKPRASASG
jgi:ribosomal protein L11 methyltransferase